MQPGGVEPPTYRSVVCRSIQLSYGCTALRRRRLSDGGAEGNRGPPPVRRRRGSQGPSVQWVGWGSGASARRSRAPRPAVRPAARRRKDEGKLVLRRGFQISPNEKFVVIEDVVTRGGRVQETIDIVRTHGGIVSAVGVIVDRSGAAKPAFGCPFVSLIEMNVETFPQTTSRPISPKFPPLSLAAVRSDSPKPPRRLGQSPLPSIIQTIVDISVKGCSRIGNWPRSSTNHL